MTLIQALRREADILIMMQNEHLRLAQFCIEQWGYTEDPKWLGKAAKAQFTWEFNRDKIGWIEELLERYSND